MIALVAVSAAIYAIDKPYSYLIPPSIDVHPGMRVMVPFGKGNRRTEGIVLDVCDGTEQGLKAIDDALDQAPVLSSEFLRLAAFLRDRYFCTYYDAIKAILPAGLWFDTEETLYLAENKPSEKWLKQHETANEIISFIQDRGGRCPYRDIRKSFSAKPDTEEEISLLKKRRFIRTNLDFSKRSSDKTEKIVSLCVPAEQAMEAARKKQKSAPMQYEVLKLLCSVGSGSTKEISYLTGASSQTFRRLEGLGFISFSSRDIFRSSLPDYVEPAGPLQLNIEQRQVFESLLKQSKKDTPGISLLYGVTGSGKTSVYLSLIQNMLDQERSSILLVPEIALTPQLVRILMSHFGKTVAVLHSALRITERYDAWKRIRQGDARVVVGTRSAVFAPVKNLGLIILDEEHEHTYKSENSPRYHAREVAIYRGIKEHTLVVLGSATPSVETMYLAKTGVYGLCTLRHRYNGKSLPTVEIVDMKQEIRRGNADSLSVSLREALTDAWQKQKQSILFLNRRGAGQHLICVGCGYVPYCPRCSVSLTYHRANGRLMCHYCGYSIPMEEECPKCGSHYKIIGSGTQRVEQEVMRCLPGASVLRMDADTVTAANSHEVILEQFKKENIPVLVGTQMVTKGLNFENVVLVGVVDADMSLYVNHYRASETTFSTLTQVIGRSGRGVYAGKAIIQTMTPEHTVIQLAAKQDYDTFYELEIGMRQMQMCPPFADLITIIFSGYLESAVVAASYEFREKAEATFCLPEYAALHIQILGPSPANVTKINNLFRYRLNFRCENNRITRLLVGSLMKSFAKNNKYKGISVYADVNSYE